ncbi:MAG: patatin [Actinobacteria bacterium]|nr:MAG: patatin [Actinomycetota bacterium]
MRRALVLGGGGITGIAWEIGVLAGLRDAGVDLAAADVIIGTSAGSVVGALVATVDLDHAVSLVRTAAGQELSFPVDMSLLAQAFGILADTSLAPDEARARLGALALSAPVGDEHVQVDRFAEFLPVHEWPAQPRLVITAVDADTGEPLAWDDADGVPLIRAVAASCAVPCVFPPVTINGRRYIDGGVRSVTNADLASGVDAAVVIAPVSGAFRHAPEAELRALGEIPALLIGTDEAAQEVIGPDVLDLSRARAALNAGMTQGETVAEQVAAVWAMT